MVGSHDGVSFELGNANLSFSHHLGHASVPHKTVPLWPFLIRIMHSLPGVPPIGVGKVRFLPILFQDWLEDGRRGNMHQFFNLIRGGGISIVARVRFGPTWNFLSSGWARLQSPFFLRFGTLVWWK